MSGPGDAPEGNDQKSATPQRLQGLSPRGGSRGGARGGRFMPNAVGRRSKEQRESTAPAVKPHENEEGHDMRRLQQRGKMERRKARQLGTRAEAAGPLAAPTIASGESRAMPLPSSGSTTSISHSGAGRTVKSEQEIESMQAHLIVGDDGRIDVATGGNGEAFFPLRVPSSAALSGATDSKVDETAEVGVTSEAPWEPEAKLENQHEVLNFEEGQLYLVQLPPIGHLSAGKAPRGAPFTEGVKEEDTEMPDAQLDALDEVPPPSLEKSSGSEGLLGTLRRHASGKTTLVIDGAVFDVTRGSNSVSVEDVVLLDDDGRAAYPLGSVKSRVLVTPNLDSLHI